MIGQKIDISPETLRSHGLLPKEYKKIVSILGREPNLTELGIFSVMWSEHCSYKSSKKWLKTLPTEAPWVICGPGENAGVIDIGDGLAAVFKMESHNHPSYIEPHQGAATGVGGIMRDVFTMGARPVANLNALRFGNPEHPKTRHLVSGVIDGIGGYGNCVGVPTVGGECEFHDSYNGNILVNAMTVGIAKKDKIFYSAATGSGNPIVYVGSKTGRDGIHGATMASTEFTENSAEKKPTVQVGDPFAEKLLIEACLELMNTNSIISIQDMGAAGLTSSSFEMASKGGVGLKINLDRVPQREADMTAYEMMLSESQERMLMVLAPGSEKRAKKIFEKWGLDFSIIGEVTSSGYMVLTHRNKVVANLPIEPLVDAAPEYDRKWTKNRKPQGLNFADIDSSKDIFESLKVLISCPNKASKRWIWEQYDYMVMGDTLNIGRPGGDAALVRVHGTKKVLAITSDCTPRYCAADPLEGGRQAVVEAWRNISATGAKPLAITDNLNFGNPEKPEIMGQFVSCIEGIREASNALEFPVVSGNVSFYNETNGKAIMPTPTIGGVGLIDDMARAVGIGFAKEKESIILVGESKGSMGCSLYLSEIEGREDGSPPAIDLAAERKNSEFVRGLIKDGLVSACHDISSGGLLVAITEMALAGGIGCTITSCSEQLPSYAWAFGEDQARYLIVSEYLDQVVKKAQNENVVAEAIGFVGGKYITWEPFGHCLLSNLREKHEQWFPGYMSRPCN